MGFTLVNGRQVQVALQEPRACFLQAQASGKSSAVALMAFEQEPGGCVIFGGTPFASRFNGTPMGGHSVIGQRSNGFADVAQTSVCKWRKPPNWVVSRLAALYSPLIQRAPSKPTQAFSLQTGTDLVQDHLTSVCILAIVPEHLPVRTMSFSLGGGTVS